MSDDNTSISQAVIPLREVNLAAGSDRVKAPVADAGSLDSGKSQTSLSTKVDHLAENATSGAGLQTRQQKDQTEWHQARDRLERLIVDLHEFVKPKKNIHTEIKTKATAVVNAFRRLKALDELRRQHLVPELGVTGYIPVYPRPRIDSETTMMDSEVEDSSVSQSNREVRRAVRRKRSKDSPETSGKQPKKVKQQLPVNTTVPPTVLSDQPIWTTVTGKKKRKEKRQQTGKLSPKQLSDKKKGDRKKRKTPSKRAVRPDALIVRPNDKTKYADILRRVKKDVSSEDAIGCVDKIRRTATGDMLIILSKKTTDGAPKLRAAIAEVLKDEAAVSSKGPQEDLEIKDLDDITTKDDVIAALQAVAGADYEIKADVVKSLRRAYGGTQTASVRLEAATAEKILGEHGKIKIGWVNCRVRRVECPLKCFKCWQYGHLAIRCKSTVDRSKLCVKCAEERHKVKDCNNEPRCALCTEKDDSKNCAHVAGSSRCPTYREALRDLSNKRR
ncbi:uncharacterized protein LOC135171048 [Diachasmimorpha longicaudata]|uniref:uncharacterized protein LOC135171048 n=1 Tax=Diachasmimorpha longicaudata TaxID=58733 RepID=UPI0030B8D6AC